MAQRSDAGRRTLRHQSTSLSNRDRQMRALEAERFWLSFSPEQYDQSSIEELRPFVWAGVPPGCHIRTQLYPLLMRFSKSRRNPVNGSETRQLSQEVKQNIDLELGMENCCSHIGGLGEGQREIVQRMVMEQARRSGADTYDPGAVQLASLLLNECRGDEQLAQTVLCCVLQIIRPYFSECQVRLRRDMLVLADLLAMDFSDLADHFNRIGFDVVDLSDCAGIWANPLFVYHFPVDMVLRIVDLVLLEGTSVILPVIFGVIAMSSDQLLAQNDIPSLYRLLSVIPETMQKEHADNIMALASSLAADKSRLVALRAEKDWVRTMDLPSIPTFAPNVGTGWADTVDPDDKSSSRRNSGRHNVSTQDSAFAAARQKFAESEEVDAGDATSLYSMGLRDLGPMPGTISRRSHEPALLRHMISFQSSTGPSDELLSVNAGLQQRVQEADAHIELQRARIDKLELELSKLELRLKKPGPGTVRAHFEMTTNANAMPSAVVRELRAHQSRALDSGITDIDNDDEPPSKQLSISYDENDSRENFRSFSFGQMHEVFSRVHEVLDFPCIYIEGYLMKLSRAGLFGRRVLHRRWFVLKGRYLTYFKSPLHTKPQKDRCTSMRGAQISCLSNHPKGDFAIVISTQDQSSRSRYLLFASSLEEQEKWASSLEVASKVNPP